MYKCNFHKRNRSIFKSHEFWGVYILMAILKIMFSLPTQISMYKFYNHNWKFWWLFTFTILFASGRANTKTVHHIIFLAEFEAASQILWVICYYIYLLTMKDVRITPAFFSVLTMPGWTLSQTCVPGLLRYLKC